MKLFTQREDRLDPSRSEGFGSNLLSWGVLGAAVASIVLIPVSFLPAIAVVIVLVWILALALPTSADVRWAAFPIAFLPVVSLTAVATFGNQAIPIVVVLLATLLIVVYRQPMLSAIGLPEVALGLLAIALAIGATHGGGSSILFVSFRSLMPLFLSWILGRALARTSGSGETLWWIGVAFLIINAPLGILEAVTGSDLIAYPETGLVNIGSTDFVRPNGFTSTDIDFALSISICIALVLGGSAPADRNSWVLPIASMGSIAVILSSFRTGWIVLAAIWIWWLLTRGSRFWVLAVAALLAAIPILIAPIQEAANSTYFQERVLDQGNVDARSVAVGQAWQLFTSHPILGVGLNAFQVDPLVLSNPGVVVTSHNLWFGALAELGLIGGMALLAVAVSTIWMSWVLLRRGRRPLPSGARGAVWACAVLIPYSLTFEILSVPVSAMLAGFAMGTVRGLFLARGQSQE